MYLAQSSKGRAEFKREGFLCRYVWEEGGEKTDHGEENIMKEEREGPGEKGEEN